MVDCDVVTAKKRVAIASPPPPVVTRDEAENGDDDDDDGPYIVELVRDNSSFFQHIDACDEVAAANALKELSTKKRRLEAVSYTMAHCAPDFMQSKAEWFISILRTLFHELVDADDEVDALCYLGKYSMLHISIWRDSSPFVKFLVQEKKANVNICPLGESPNSVIMSPLCLSILFHLDESTKNEVCEILLQNGADLEFESIDNGGGKRAAQEEAEEEPSSSTLWDAFLLGVESHSVILLTYLRNYADSNWKPQYAHSVARALSHCEQQLLLEEEKGGQGGQGQEGQEGQEGTAFVFRAMRTLLAELLLWKKKKDSPPPPPARTMRITRSAAAIAEK